MTPYKPQISKTNRPDYLLSEGDVLRQIKKLQYRAQILPLIIIAFSFWMTITFGHIAWLRIVFMILTLAGLIGFFITALQFRYRNRIPMPEPDSVYCPNSGKVQNLQVLGNKTIFEIVKHRFDPVEIRCPADNCILEAGELILPHEDIRISFSADRIIRIENARMKAGEVIFLMLGKGRCRIEMPKNLPLLLKNGASCDSGSSRIYTRQSLSQG
ncbi:MAG: hypothetical protein PWP64_250 [Candidatus Cloacimonadota bacterium]|nr:hypothetical protein [Candidatus Cloacimonadota bacterium]